MPQRATSDQGTNAQRTLESGAFFGRSVVVKRVAGLIIVDSLHSAGLRVPRHEHEHAYLSLIRDGGFRESYGRRQRVVVPGMLLVSPPGEGHSEHMEDHPVSSLNIELSADWLRELFEAGSPLDRPAHIEGEQIVSLRDRLLREVARQDADSSLAIQSLTWEILSASVLRRPVPPDRAMPRWLRGVRDIIDGTFDRTPALGLLAQEVGVHPVHFAVVFRRYYGCSLGEYSRRRRLDEARRRLADNGTSLSRIALDLGFADQSHFTRTFKRFTGMTPQRYRTLLQFKTG